MQEDMQVIPGDSDTFGLKLSVQLSATFSWILHAHAIDNCHNFQICICLRFRPIVKTGARSSQQLTLAPQ